VAGTLEARRRGLAIRLAQLLSDPGGPTAPVHYAVPGEDRWVCADGTAAGPANGFMVVTDAGVPIARVKADPALVKDGGRLGPARALSVRNAQLRAVARARTHDLHAARRRIVEVADAEGRRMERDLHDGAQQRLVSSALYLALAQRDTPDITALTEAEHGILVALTHLRDIAHGLAPESLRTGGVWAGVAILATSASIPVATDLPVNGPADEMAGTALYFGQASVFEVATDCAASGIEVRGSDASGVLRADMTVHGAMLAVPLLADAADRLAACDGLLEVSLSGDGCRVTLEVPCA
jgi:signal transduction histidine kinase